MFLSVLQKALNPCEVCNLRVNGANVFGTPFDEDLNCLSQGVFSASQNSIAKALNGKQQSRQASSRSRGGHCIEEALTILTAFYGVLQEPSRRQLRMVRTAACDTHTRHPVHDHVIRLISENKSPVARHSMPSCGSVLEWLSINNTFSLSCRIWAVVLWLWVDDMII